MPGLLGGLGLPADIAEGFEAEFAVAAEGRPSRCVDREVADVRRALARMRSPEASFSLSAPLVTDAMTRDGSQPTPTARPGRVVQSATRAAAMAFGVLLLLAIIQFRLTVGRESWPTVLALAAPFWVGWWVASPLLLRVTVRWRFAPGQRLASTVIHVGALIAMQLALGVLSWQAVRLLQPEVAATSSPGFVELLIHPRLPLTVLLYFALFGLTWSCNVWWSRRDQAEQLERAERLAAESRHQALAARLRPHVLFNTMHTIGVLVERDPATARAMMAELGTLLRDLLDDDAPTLVPLDEEFDLLDRYLALERHRFGDRLRVNRRVPEELRGVLVPRLLLQPLVENAIHHGLARKGGGEVQIAVGQDDGWLELEVRDDGDGVGAVVQERIGLGATRARLASIWPMASVALRAVPGQGASVVIRIPTPLAGQRPEATTRRT